MEITKNVGDGKFAPEKRVQNMLRILISLKIVMFDVTTLITGLTKLKYSHTNFLGTKSKSYETIPDQLGCSCTSLAI